MEQLADLIERGDLKLAPLPSRENIRCDEPAERARRLRAAARALREKMLLGKFVAPRARFRDAAD